MSDLLSTELRYRDEGGECFDTTLEAVAVSRLHRAAPVRRVRSVAGRRNYPGLFWSATTGAHVPYESRLELDRLWLADFDADVAWIAAQPMWVTGVDDGVRRRHAPDLLLTLRGGGVLVVDVKPLEFARLEEVAAVFRWTGRLCRSRGWAYEVWTGGDPVRLANIRALGVARRREHIDQAELRVVEERARDGLSLGQVAGLSAHSSAKPLTAAVLAQVWAGVLSIDMEKPLSWSSTIRVSR